jgi:hypothetical protein
MQRSFGHAVRSDAVVEFGTGVYKASFKVGIILRRRAFAIRKIWRAACTVTPVIWLSSGKNWNNQKNRSLPLACGEIVS